MANVCCQRKMMKTIPESLFKLLRPNLIMGQNELWENLSRRSIY